MKQLQIVPAIYEYATFGDFAAAFSLTERDLILTNEYIYEPLLKKSGAPCRVIFQEKYGAGEPTDKMADEILKEMHAAPCDRIVAVGGGTILDLAKVLSVAKEGKMVDDLYADMGALSCRHPLLALPTTCGTGSEVTNIAILNRLSLGTKQGLVSDAMYPSAAVLVPELLTTLPYGVFATSSLDALIHAAESILSPLATDYTRLFSVAAIREILEGYREVAQNKERYRALGGKFLKAANLAGIAFSNAGCGTVLAMSYALGGKYHVAHGESNYRFFLPVLRLYQKRRPEGAIKGLEKEIAAALGAENALDALGDLLEKILPQKPMRAYGAGEEDLEPFAESTVKNQQRLLGRSYVPLTKEDIKALFASCL